MSTMMGNTRRVILFGAAGAVMAVFAASVARADVASDKPGAVLIFPKVVVDTRGVFGPPTDTEIQLTNTSNSLVSVRCFWVDADSHCNNGISSNPNVCVGGTAAGTTCTTDSQCAGGFCPPNSQCTPEGEAIGGTVQHCINGGVCLAGWSENDFRMTLTKRQPIAWKASDGLNPFPCDGLNTFCHDNQSNKGNDGSLSSIPGVQENPFFGELKCVEVDPLTFEPIIGENPDNNFAGDLKAEVTIVSKGVNGSVDARKYNAVALQSTGFQDDNPLALNVGGPDGVAEYNGCPNILILNHFFDDAVVGTHKSGSTFQVNGSVTTDLTVVPCGEDFATQTVTPVTLQFLVFNEFEQRFSTSTNFSCWREVQLSDIDTRVGPFGNSQSIFNFAVEGTLSGQTRIRSVVGSDTGNTIVGVAEEFWSSTNGPGGRFTDAANVHFTGSRDQGDVINIPADQ